MEPDALRDALRERGLERQVLAAKALRVNQATVSRWLAAEAPIPQWVELALVALDIKAVGRKLAQARKAKRRAKR